jgi:hypothetical protein
MSCLYNIFFKTNKIYVIDCEPCETEYSTNECAICLDSMNAQTLTISCGHTYHSNCLLNWFEYNMTCPVCRTQFIWAKKKKKKRRHYRRWNPDSLTD